GALRAQVALERDIPLEQSRRMIELAPGDVRQAENVRCDHLYRVIAQRARNGEGLFPEADCLFVGASGIALDHHESRDPPEPVLVAERSREHLCGFEVFAHTREIAE